MKKTEERMFEQFIQKYEQRTMNFLSSKYPVLSEEAIRDIMQDAYVTLHKNIEAKKVVEPQYPYFLKICNNLSLKAIYKKGKHVILGINDTDIQQKDMISMHRVESILQVCEEQETVINEKKQLVHDALGKMASKCREMLWSFYAEELSWATIAGIFGLKNADSAKSQAFRCRQTFKEKYNQLRMMLYGQ